MIYKILITIDSRSWFVNDSEGIPREWDDYDEAYDYATKLSLKHPDWIIEVI